MHFHLEIVFLGEPPHLTTGVDNALAPFCQGVWPNGFWDWYQIGGRWRGVHDATYSQDEDQSLIEKCDLCDGTGTRRGGLQQFGPDWFALMNGCNGCHGKGTRMSWPTEWKPHPIDAVSIAKVRPDLAPHTVILADRYLEPKAFHDTGKSLREILSENGIEDCFVVTVDCHS
jgi:hypothetical protein